MAGLSTIALVGGLALSAAGTGVQYAAAQDASDASKRAENARRAQMELEASRKKRELIRQGIIARAQATAVGTNQGAQDSSALAGALGGITGTETRGVQGVNSSVTLGREVFAANQQIAEAQELGALGQGLSSLGGAVNKQLGTIGRLGYNYGIS